MKALTLFAALVLGLSLNAQPRHLTVKQFLKLSPADTSAYVVKGVVTKIRNGSNGAFYMTDGTGTMLVYGIQDGEDPLKTFKQMNIMKGDTVAVAGRFLLYAGQTKEMKDGRLLYKADGPEHGKSFMEQLDRQPQFQGKSGKAAFDCFEEWVRARVTQPADGAKGTVIVSYAVGKNGKVQEVQIYKGATPSLNEAVLQVVKSSPKWKPAVMDGNPVRLTGLVKVVVE